MRALFPATILAALFLVGCGTTLTSKNDHNLVLTRPDEDIAAASKKAQDELPKFLERLQHPKPGEQFAINANFRDHATFEHMWVDHLKYDGKVITGKLADEPVLIKRLKKGEDVIIAKQVVYDWLIRSNGKTEGGYVQQVLKKKQGG